MTCIWGCDVNPAPGPQFREKDFRFCPHLAQHGFVEFVALLLPVSGEHGFRLVPAVLWLIANIVLSTGWLGKRIARYHRPLHLPPGACATGRQKTRKPPPKRGLSLERRLDRAFNASLPLPGPDSEEDKGPEGPLSSWFFTYGVGRITPSLNVGRIALIAVVRVATSPGTKR